MEKNRITTSILRTTRSGQALLTLVLIIGGIVAMIGISLLFFANSFLSSSTSSRFANRLDAVAHSGIDDALLQLARNKDFSSQGYTLTVGSDTATVIVTQGIPVTNEITIISTAKITSAFGVSKALKAVVSKDPLTGQTSLLSLGNTLAITGSVGFITTTTALPAAIKYHSAVVYNGYIYTTGGFSSTNSTSTVNYAPINSNGTVGAWSTTTALPSNIYNYSAVVYNGYIYTTGGFSSTNSTSTVFYAPINSNGTVGAWSTTTALPSATYEHSAVVYNGYIYTTGGLVNGSNPTSTVNYAPINSNGTVGAWSTTTPLPSVLYIHSAIVYNGYLYTTGGSAAAVTSTVFYAPINSNGTVGAWSTTTALPSAIFFHSAVVYNGYIYTTGGLPGPTSTVFYAPLQ